MKCCLCKFHHLLGSCHIKKQALLQLDKYIPRRSPRVKACSIFDLKVLAMVAQTNFVRSIFIIYDECYAFILNTMYVLLKD